MILLLATHFAVITQELIVINFLGLLEVMLEFISLLLACEIDMKPPQFALEFRILWCAIFAKVG